MPSPDDMTCKEIPEYTPSNLTVNEELARLTWELPKKLRLILSKEEDYDSLSSEEIQKIIASDEKTLILIIACNINKLRNISKGNIESLIYLGYFDQIKSSLEQKNLLEEYSNIVATRFITLWNIDCLAKHLKDLSELSFSTAKSLIEWKKLNIVLTHLKSFSQEALKDLFTFFVKKEQRVNAERVLDVVWETKVSLKYLEIHKANWKRKF